MGPRRWGRGRRRRSLSTSPSRRSLQWGHGAGAVEDAGLAGRQLDRRSLQWGHGAGAVEDTARSTDASERRPRFNGATALGPWKTRGRVKSAIEAAELQWGHGAGAVEDRQAIAGAAVTARRFNGATALGPWKTRSRRSRRAIRVMQASMGPRRWGRGRRPRPSGTRTEARGLQWGHGAGAVEDVRAPRSGSRHARRFNGATALGPWKTRAAAPAEARDAAGFNGATALGPWKTRLPAAMSRHRLASFNGATALGPWKTSSSAGTSERTRSSLQWGHGAGAVEDVEAFRRPIVAGSGFNGATALGPWKTVATRGDRMVRGACFNGATALGPWKTAPIGMKLRRIELERGRELLPP